MPIGFSDGNVYEDELHLAGGVGDNVYTGRPHITITKQQHPFEKALDHLRTDDPIQTFIDNELGRTQAPMPRPDPRGSRPTYEEGEPIPGQGSYGSDLLGGPEYKKPLLPPSAEEPAKSPLYNPDKGLPSAPQVIKTGTESDLSSMPVQQENPLNGASQNASQIDSKPRGGDSSLRELVRQGARWIQEKTGIGKTSHVEEFLWKLQNSSEIMKGYFEGKIDQSDPAFIGAVTQLLSTAGNVGLATAPLRTNSVGIFGGMLGGARKDVAVKELIPRLEKALPEEEVTRLTGWWKGEDGKWRFEIPDKDASINQSTLKELVNFADNSATKAAQIDLDAILKHDKLYSFYPELQNYKIIYSKDKDFAERYSGMFFEKQKTIVVGENFINSTSEEKMRTLLHELQHGVQAIEGFARGGNPESSKYWRKANELEPLVQQGKDKFIKERGKTSVVTLEDLKVIKELNDANRKVLEFREKARQEYLNLLGEREARQVEENYSKAISPLNPANVKPRKQKPKQSLNTKKPPKV